MTDEQLDVARRNIPHLASRIGYTNLEFKKGLIEDIKSVGIPDGSIDLAISNCVVNLSPDKPRVFREVYDALRIGGEFYFSDVNYNDILYSISLITYFVIILISIFHTFTSRSMLTLNFQMKFVYTNFSGASA